MMRDGDKWAAWCVIEAVRLESLCEPRPAEVAIGADAGALAARAAELRNSAAELLRSPIEGAN